LTGDWHLAEDLVQTALMRCYPKWRQIAKGDSDAYVRRAIFTTYVSWWRRRWRGERSTAEVPERVSPSDGYSDVDQRRLVMTALAALPARQRAVVVLRFYEDLTEAQTAEVLECAIGTVKSQTVKALGNLRAGGLLLAHDMPEVSHD
jgi:RNA polymerase sigma-70 factor (sigma-E family)